VKGRDRAGHFEVAQSRRGMCISPRTHDYDSQDGRATAAQPRSGGHAPLLVNCLVDFHQ
jgi:hypothetical protein